jgi:hypothetical protein
VLQQQEKCSLSPGDLFAAETTAGVAYMYAALQHWSPGIIQGAPLVTFSHDFMLHDRVTWLHDI